MVFVPLTSCCRGIETPFLKYQGVISPASRLQLCRLQEKDVVFKVYVLVEVVLELLEFLIRDHEGIADIARYGIFLCEMADRVDRIANHLMLVTEFRE